MMASHGDAFFPQVCWAWPTQVPLSSQASKVVQNRPSSHEVPFGAGTTTHVFSGPSSCPVLHTATVHCGVSNDEQSTPQGPRSAPPAPLLLLLLLLLLMLMLMVQPAEPHRPAVRIPGAGVV